jgi:hypothetical protein
MPTFDFRVLLETVEGVKTSYMSQSFVDTSQNLVLSSSQVYHRIVGGNNFSGSGLAWELSDASQMSSSGMTSCSYQNQLIFSGSDFNSNVSFGDNTLLSASMVGGYDTGSIEFKATNTEYDRLYRYKFFGEKVCNVLGLPHAQWIYVDQFALNTDDDSNFFEGNVNAENLFIGDSLTFANDATVNSDIPFLINTGSDRHIKFIDERGTATRALIIGYDKDNDVYEISGSISKNFNIGGLDKLFFSDGTVQTSAGAGGGSGTVAGSNTQVQFNDGGSFGGDAGLVYDKNSDTLTAVNITATKVTTTQFTSSVITSSIIQTEGSNIFGDTIEDTQTFNGHITASGNISSSGTGINYFGGDVKISNGADILLEEDQRIFFEADKETWIESHAADSFRVVADGNQMLLLDYDTGNRAVFGNSTKVYIGANNNALPNKELIVEGDISASGDLHIQGNITASSGYFDGAITASGNISASGTIISNDITADAVTGIPSILNSNLVIGYGSTDAKIDFSTDNNIDFTIDNTTQMKLTDGVFRPTTDSDVDLGATGTRWKTAYIDDIILTNDMTIPGTLSNVSTTNITASGNISASGFISTDGHITASNISASGTVFASKFESAGPSGEIINFNDNLTVIGHITASGNISASGTSTGSFGAVYTVGRVGIGTTDPKSSLHIEEGEIRVDAASGGTSVIRLSEGDNTRTVLRHKGGDNRFELLTDNASGADTTRLIVLGEQDATAVGIGTTTPSNTLEVAGNISSSGAIHTLSHITASGNLEITGDISGSINTSGSFGHVLSRRVIVNDLDNSGPTWPEIYVEGQILASGQVTSDNSFRVRSSGADVILISNDGIISSSGDLHIDGNITASRGFFSGAITASNNISSSGTFIGGGLNINGTTTFNDGDITNVGDIALDTISSDAGTSIGVTLGTDAGDDFNVGSNKLVVEGDTGRVGIGTNAPSALLTIAGAGGETSGITFTNDGQDDEVDMYFSNNDDNSDFVITYVGTGGAELTLEQSGDLLLNASNGDNVGIGTASPTEKLDVVGNIKTSGNISSPTFESGFAGSGFRIESGSGTNHSFTIDDLTVRGTMSVFELLIHQIRATNGSLFVSNTGKITSASLSDVSNHYSMSFDTGSGYGHSFVVGDLVRAQRFVPSTNGSGSQVFKSDLHIISVNNTGSAVGVLTGSDDPRPGYEYVRIGSTTTADRKGSIYLTADDDNAPFIDVVDEITAHSQFNTSGKVKVRMGKLDGITTANPIFGSSGTLSGFGMYASGSVFLEGSINATAGKIAEFTISTGSISSDGDSLILRSKGQITGSKVLFDGGTIGGFGIGTNFISSSNKNLILTDDGQITGSAVSMSGVITATKLIASTAGEIGGFTIDTEEIKSTNLLLDSTNEKITLGSSNAVILQGGGTDNFITMGNKTTFGQSTNVGAILGMDNDQPTLELFEDANNTFIFNDSGVEIKTSGTAVLSGSSVEVLSPNVFLGQGNLNFISASGGNLEISSSNFHLLGGNITASSVDLTGAITAESGKIAGWDIDGDILKNGTDIQLDGGNKKITINDQTFGNDGIQLEFNSADTPRAFIGKKTGGFLKFDGTNLELSSSTFVLGDRSTAFVSSSDSNLEISSSNFHLVGGKITASSVDLSGSIKAESGVIGGFDIGTDLSSTNADTTLILKGETGQITSSAGLIGGFSIGEDSLSRTYDKDGGGDEDFKIVLNTSGSPALEFFHRHAESGSGASGVFDRTMVITSVEDDFGENTAIISASHGAINMKRSYAYGTGASFTAGNKVLMSDNTYKNIEDIEKGDGVISYHVGKQKLCSSSVKLLKTHSDTSYYIINDKLEATGNHKIYTSSGWKYVNQLQVGDELLDNNLEFVTINSLEFVEENVNVYDIVLNGNVRNYFIENIFVHNALQGQIPDTSEAFETGINTITGISDYSGSAGALIRTAGVAGLAVGAASQSIITHIGVYGSSSVADNHYAGHFVGAKTYVKQLVVGGDDSLGSFNIPNPPPRLGTTKYELTVAGHITASGTIRGSSFIINNNDGSGGDIPLVRSDSTSSFVTHAETGSLVKNVTISATQGVFNKVTGDGVTTGVSTMTNLGTTGKPLFSAITASNEITSSTLKVASNAQFGPSSVYIDGIGGHITASGNISGSSTSTFQIGGKLQAGSKSFLINRPEGGKLEYGALEGQQNDVFYRGELKGDNVIYLPKEWEWLVDENTITVQLTSIGKHQELFVKEIKNNKIFIDINGMFKTKQDIHCYHIIHGTRKDVELIRNYQ